MAQIKLQDKPGTYLLSKDETEVMYLGTWREIFEDQEGEKYILHFDSAIYLELAPSPSVSSEQRKINELADPYHNAEYLDGLQPSVSVPAEPQFHTQNMDGQNIEDLQKWVETDQLEAIVDEKVGGIIGYVNPTHSRRITDLLNAATPAPATSEEYDDEFKHTRTMFEDQPDQDDDEDIEKLENDLWEQPTGAPQATSTGEHTPGEWWVNESGHPDNGRIQIGTSKDYIAELYDNTNEPEDENYISKNEMEANARLIASAPSLLKENQQLKEKIEFLETLRISQNTHSAKLIEQNQKQAKDIKDLREGLMIAQNYVENFIAKGGIGEGEKDLNIIIELLNRI